MSILPRIAELHDEMTAWRRDFHAHPELLYDVGRTAGVVAERLRSFGCDEVTTGIGRTGVVGVIRGRGAGAGRSIGLRADMDALPIEEATGLPYASQHPGKMHACGHDGHTTMLLGAAKYLCETRAFRGTAVVIFQPAEEGGAGARAMVEDGLMERWGIEEVYGMHNFPGLPLGRFATRSGPLLAAADRLYITIEGRGGHAAKPHYAVDPVLAASHVVVALQSIVSRNVDPLESAVVSICQFQAGTTDNVIPREAKLVGTVRSLLPEIRDLLERRIHEVAESTARAHGATATVHYQRDYPVTRNHPEQTEFAAGVAGQVVGAEQVNVATPPVMGGEDFAFMLESRPGAFVFIGNGDTAPIHHPAYDFNDAALPYGASYWARLVETASGG